MNYKETKIRLEELKGTGEYLPALTEAYNELYEKVEKQNKVIDKIKRVLIVATNVEHATKYVLSAIKDTSRNKIKQGGILAGGHHNVDDREFLISRKTK